MKLIIAILIFGVIYKLLTGANGNFLFNMDNGRDMVDVREMVVLKNPRLIGPRTPIEGVFDGPFWYYLLAIPFILSNGDPYASILLEIIFWAVGGFFLLKLVSRWGKFLILPIGFLWIASDYIGLTTQYAFNPNPLTLLTPFFIFLYVRYLETGKFIFIALTFLLGGLFFNFEMNFGIFIPLIILVSTIFIKKIEYLRTRNFWVGSLFFIFFLIPQIIFDFKNNFLMTKAFIDHFLNPTDLAFSVFRHLQTIFYKFFDVFSSTLMNHKSFSYILFLFSIPVFIKVVKQKNYLVTVALSFILIPFIIYTFFSSISVSPWHLGAPAVAGIILVGFILRTIWDSNFLGKITTTVLSILIIYFAVTNIFGFFFNKKEPNMDQSLLRNEIAVIDFVYKYADSKNFKVYIFLPSIYDYPYQYLFWWYGLKKYGYLPKDYAYLPDRPNYIPGKQSFSSTKEDLKKRDDSNIVFLIKEKDTNNSLPGWEGNFINLESIVKQKIGLVEVDIRKEFRK